MSRVSLKPVNVVLVDTMDPFFGGGPGSRPGPGRRIPAFDARGIRVLLVEDNQLNQQVATELLEGAGPSSRSRGTARSPWIASGRPVAAAV